MPEGLLPGVPQHYATTLPLAGYGRGVIVTAFEGRPTKIEGNPRHPASLGATDVFAQAEILSLYDPDRSQTVRAARRDQRLARFRERVPGADSGEHAEDKGGGLAAAYRPRHLADAARPDRRAETPASRTCAGTVTSRRRTTTPRRRAPSMDSR